MYKLSKFENGVETLLRVSNRYELIRRMKTMHRDLYDSGCFDYVSDILALSLPCFWAKQDDRVISYKIVKL